MSALKQGRPAIFVREWLEQDVAKVAYRVLDTWVVVFTGVAHDEIDGPTSVAIEPWARSEFRAPDEPRDLPRDEALTTEVMRALPMREARERIEALKLRFHEAEGNVTPMPGRFESDADYAALAALYVERVNGGDRSPIRGLAQRHGLSRETLSTRIRVARERQLLTRPSKGDKGQLTEKARALLEPAGNQDGQRD